MEKWMWMTALLVAGAVQAELINYTESSDFSARFDNPTPIPGALDIGVNTISGTMPDESGEMVDSDCFSVSNPNGYNVSSVTVSISNYYAPSGGGEGHISIQSPSSGWETVFGNGTVSLDVTDADASDFVFRFAGPENMEERTAGSMDYTVSINVVPEPATAGLLGLSVGALWLLRRLKNHYRT